MPRRVCATQQHAEWCAGQVAAAVASTEPVLLNLPVTRSLFNTVCCERNKSKRKLSLLVFCPQMWTPKNLSPSPKTLLHGTTEILRVFLLMLKSHSLIYAFTVLWHEVDNEVGCLRYSVQCSEHACMRGFSFKKTWRWLHCILTVKLVFSLLGFICVFLHLLETPYLSPLKSTLTTEQI